MQQELLEITVAPFALPSVGKIDGVEHVSGLVPPSAEHSGSLRLQTDLDRQCNRHQRQCQDEEREGCDGGQPAADAGQASAEGAVAEPVVGHAQQGGGHGEENDNGGRQDTRIDDGAESQVDVETGDVRPFQDLYYLDAAPHGGHQQGRDGGQHQVADHQVVAGVSAVQGSGHSPWPSVLHRAAGFAAVQQR